MDSPTKVEQVIRACFAAFASRDRSAMESLLAEDFHFTSPLDNRLDRDGFFKYCWAGGEGIERFDILHLVVDGERGFVTYEARMGQKVLRNTEIQTVRGGKVVDTEVYFGWEVPHPAKRGQHKD